MLCAVPSRHTVESREVGSWERCTVPTGIVYGKVCGSRVRRERNFKQWLWVESREMVRITTQAAIRRKIENFFLIRYPIKSYSCRTIIFIHPMLPIAILRFLLLHGPPRLSHRHHTRCHHHFLSHRYRILEG